MIDPTLTPTPSLPLHLPPAPLPRPPPPPQVRVGGRPHPGHPRHRGHRRRRRGRVGGRRLLLLRPKLLRQRGGEGVGGGLCVCVGGGWGLGPGGWACVSPHKDPVGAVAAGAGAATSPASCQACAPRIHLKASHLPRPCPRPRLPSPPPPAGAPARAGARRGRLSVRGFRRRRLRPLPPHPQVVAAPRPLHRPAGGGVPGVRLLGAHPRRPRRRRAARGGAGHERGAQGGRGGGGEAGVGGSGSSGGGGVPGSGEQGFLGELVLGNLATEREVRCRGGDGPRSPMHLPASCLPPVCARRASCTFWTARARPRRGGRCRWGASRYGQPAPLGTLAAFL